MFVGSNASRYVTLTRKTAFVIEATEASASMSVGRALRVEAYMQVEVSGGTTGSGEITFTGTGVGGGAQSETLVFDANGFMQTTKLFDSITAITTTGFADEATVPQITVRSISADGTSQLILYTVAENIPVTLQVWGGGSWRSDQQGTVNLSMGVVVMDYYGSFVPKTGDLLTFNEDGQQWYIRDEQEVRIGYGVRPHHHRLQVERHDT